MDEVLEAKVPQPPVIVTFYSPRSTKTLSYAHAFRRAHIVFTSVGISVKFSVLDITDHPQGIYALLFSGSILVFKWEQFLIGQS